MVMTTTEIKQDISLHPNTQWYTKEEIETKIDKTYSLTIRQDNTDKFSDDLLKRFHIIH